MDNANARYHLLNKGLVYSIGRMLPDDIIAQHKLRCIPLDGVNYQMICVTNPTRPLYDIGKQFLTLLDEEIQKSSHSTEL